MQPSLTPLEREFLDSFLADAYNTTLGRVSLKGITGHGYAGEHELVEGGYSQVADALAAGTAADGSRCGALADVRLSSTVTRIEAAPGGVRVHVAGVGEPLAAHAALVTLPLGVLRHGAVQFCPPLPQYKQDAIRDLAMGTENRIVLLFPKVCECVCVCDCGAFCFCGHACCQAHAYISNASVAIMVRGCLLAVSIPFRSAHVHAVAEADAPTRRPTKKPTKTSAHRLGGASQAFWPAEPHFFRPFEGRYTLFNLHALGVDNVLSVLVRPSVSEARVRGVRLVDG